MLSDLKRFSLSSTALQRAALYWALLLAWMVAIFVLSSLPSSTIDRLNFIQSPLPFLVGQSVVHPMEFGVLAVLLYRLRLSYGLSSGPRLQAAVLLLTVAYGATDELHQSFVPGRDLSWLDLGLDALGAAVGLLVSATALALRRRSGPGG